MRTPAVASTSARLKTLLSAPSLSRRAFLQALGLACATRLRPIATRFTAIADDVVWLMRWCSYGPSLRLAGAS